MTQYADDDYSPFSAPEAGSLAAARAGVDPFRAVYAEIQKDVSGKYSAKEQEEKRPEVEQFIRQLTRDLVRQYNDTALSKSLPLIQADVETLAQRAINDLLGMGAIDDLLALDGVEDIVINGPGEVMIKRYGKWELTDVTYPDPETVLYKINQGIAHTGRQAGPLIPVVDAHLESGDRVSIVTYPVARPWPVVSIRKRHNSALTMLDFVRSGAGRRARPAPPKLPNYFKHAGPEGILTPLAAAFLHMCMVAGCNVLVVGATGIGKTTFLNVLGKGIPPDRRILVIEDTPELDIRPQVDGRARNCVYFTTRPESVEGIKPISQDALVRAALRQRPDALAIGEVRGAEIKDLLKALWTGHKNGLTSIHADSIPEVPERMRMMLQEASFTTEISDETVSLWIAKSFHLAIMYREGVEVMREVEEIVEFTGVVEGRTPAMNKVFENKGRGLELVGGKFYREKMLDRVGYSFDMIRAEAQG